MISYQTYITSKQASFAKDTSVNVLTTVNTTSLDQIICCLQPSDTSIYKLQLSGVNNTTSSTTFNQVFASNYTGQSTGDNSITAGDLYNQSVYFKSDATGLTSSSIEINNTPLMSQPLDDSTLLRKLVFTTSTTATFTPYIFCKTTRIMQVNEGHSVVVII